jgi:putative membrane protein
MMNTLRALFVAASVSVVPLAITAHAQDNTAASSQAVDKATFVTMATSSNLLEIQSSEMALQRASSQEVKDFATQMIQDHTKASEEMMAVLSQQGQAATPAMTDRHAGQLKDLADQNSNFDTAYIQLQRAAHEEAVTLFQSYASAPDDEALGAFAQKTLPTLEMHREHVMKLDASE